MRKLITFLWLLISTCSYSQDFTVSATSQSWAAGMCCARGVNYTVTVKTGKWVIDSIKVLSVCMENKRYTHSYLQLTKTKHSFTVSFGYSYNPVVDHHDGLNDKKDEKIYVNSSDNQKPCDENLIIFKLNGEIFSLKIEKVEQLFPLTYP